MLSSTKFTPNWASAPGNTVADLLSERNMSITSFASKLNTTADYVNQLIQGSVAINREISNKLEEILGPPSEFWLSRESHYREAVTRLRASEEAWLKELPLKDMISLGWIKADSKDLVSTCLDYFNVQNVTAWRNKYHVELSMVNFRTSSSFSPKSGAVAAWIRQCEIRSESIVCQPWDRKLFRLTLKEIKELTKIKDPNVFIPKLIDLCAKCGVAVAIARTPPGCQASGATKFISNDRPLLMLSFRYLTDDHFWFTFFHEAGHLLLHDKRAIFLEGENKNGVVTKEESEANEFAANELISKELIPQMMKVSAANKKAVVGFAMLAGVSPGIVIGQLQHYGRISHAKFNGYKRRFSWENIEIL